MVIKIPANEIQRLEALIHFRILDTEDEQVYDTITKLAASIMEAPIALLTFLDKDRVFVKSRIGLDAKGGTREHSFCTHTILDINNPTLIKDATLDNRFCNNPFVVGEPKIRFYFGAPLVTNNKEAIGSICVIDSVPRTDPTSFQIESMNNLSKLVIAQLELREFLFNLHDSFQELKRIITYPETEAGRLSYTQLNANCDLILEKIRARKNQD